MFRQKRNGRLSDHHFRHDTMVTVGVCTDIQQPKVHQLNTDPNRVKIYALTLHDIYIYFLILTLVCASIEAFL